MRRFLQIIVFCVILVFGSLILRFLFVDQLGDLPTTYAYTQAELIPNQDVVEVNKGSFWQQVTQPIRVEAGVQIRTDGSGVALVIFADDSVLTIEPNTLITIEEHIVSTQETHIKIFQEIGRTWSQVKKLLNPKSSYEVETQTTVATVRGTAFGVSVDENQVVDYVVGEGQIQAQVIEKVGSERKSLAKALVNSNQKIHWEKHQLKEGEFAMIEFSPEPVEVDQELKKWKEKARIKLEELEPVLKEVKQKRNKKREQDLKERERNQSILKKWSKNFRDRLGLRSRSQADDEKESFLNSLEEVPIALPSPEAIDETKLPNEIIEPVLVSPSPSFEAVQGVFTKRDTYEEPSPSPKIIEIDYDYKDREMIEDFDQLDTVDKTDDYTLFEQTFEFVE